MKNKLFYLTIFFLTNSFLLLSQTNISGGIFSDTTWSTEASPYIVTSDVAIFPGNTLTIEPGVIIKFNSGTKLIVRGNLISTTTVGNEIIFTSNSNTPVKGSWAGIEIENNQGGKIIASNIIGEYADNFIRILNSSNGEILNINNSEIKNCNRAFYGYDGSSNHTVILDNLNVNNNNYGYIYAQNVTLTNSIFSDGEKGIHCWAGSPNMYISDSEFFNFSIWPFNMGGEIDNCHIHNNAVGIRMKTNLIVKNSTIEFNTIGIEALSTNENSGANIFDNKICDNSLYNFKHFDSHPINISNNCWCSNTESEISQTIFDAYDDVSLGIVTFTPFNINCSSNLSIGDFDNTVNKNYFYPNPAENEISFINESKKIYEIYSINGLLVKKGNVTKILDVSNLVKGMYLIKILNIDQSGIIIKKLMKK